MIQPIALTSTSSLSVIFFQEIAHPGDLISVRFFCEILWLMRAPCRAIDGCVDE